MTGEIGMAEKKRVLVLCTGNSCRSQMAEGLINHFLGDRWEAYSAGTMPSRVNPYAMRSMEEIDIDITDHQAKSADVYRDRQFDWVITLCAEAEQNCPVFPGAANRAYIDFEDPANVIGSDAEIMAQFRRVREDMRQRLLDFLRAHSA